MAITYSGGYRDTYPAYDTTTGGGGTPPSLQSIQFVFDEDSLGGYGAGTGDPNDERDFYGDAPLKRWSAKLRDLELTNPAFRFTSIPNYGVSGQTIFDMVGDYQSQILPVLAQGSFGQRGIFVGGGINDAIFFNSSAQEIYDRRKAYLNGVRAAYPNEKIFTSTLTPCGQDNLQGANPRTKAQIEQVRVLFNHMVRRGQADLQYDGLFDFDAHPGLQYAEDLTVYHDKLHLLPKGNDYKAAAAKPVADLAFTGQASTPVLTGKPSTILYTPFGSGPYTLSGQRLMKVGGINAFVNSQASTLALGFSYQQVRGIGEYKLRVAGGSSLCGWADSKTAGSNDINFGWLKKDTTGLAAAFAKGAALTPDLPFTDGDKATITVYADRVEYYLADVLAYTYVIAVPTLPLYWVAAIATPGGFVEATTIVAANPVGQGGEPVSTIQETIVEEDDARWTKDGGIFYVATNAPDSQQRAEWTEGRDSVRQLVYDGVGISGDTAAYGFLNAFEVWHGPLGGTLTKIATPSYSSPNPSPLEERWTTGLLPEGAYVLQVRGRLSLGPDAHAWCDRTRIMGTARAAMPLVI
jgi:hypothetical protein